MVTRHEVFRRPPKIEGGHFKLRATSAWIAKQAYLSTHLQLTSAHCVLRVGLFIFLAKTDIAVVSHPDCFFFGIKTRIVLQWCKGFFVQKPRRREETRRLGCSWRATNERFRWLFPSTHRNQECGKFFHKIRSFSSVAGRFSSSI
jgi:hypothetical protein